VDPAARWWNHIYVGCIVDISEILTVSIFKAKWLPNGCCRYSIGKQGTVSILTAKSLPVPTDLLTCTMRTGRDHWVVISPWRWRHKTSQILAVQPTSSWWHHPETGSILELDKLFFSEFKFWEVESSYSQIILHLECLYIQIKTVSLTLATVSLNG